MKLYTTTTCPFVERVKIYVAYKNLSNKINFENIDLANPPEELLMVNPTGSVPTLLFSDGSGFAESLIIIEYLDDTQVNENNKLFGPTSKIKSIYKSEFKLVETNFLSYIQKAIYTHGMFNAVQESKETLPKAFEFFEDYLSKHTTLITDKKLNLTDIALAPFIFRYQALFCLDRTFPQPKPNGSVARYFDRIKNNETVTKSCLAGQQLTDLVKKLSTPKNQLLEIIAAPRSLVTNIVLPAYWTIHEGKNGQNLFCKLEFSSWKNSAAAIQKIQDICDTVDHHVDLNLTNLTSVEILLCTHEPKWGVSEKDLALAKVISEMSDCR